MRHAKKRNKLSRDSAHRKALLRTMSKQLIEHERIGTTQPKAKALKPEFEKLITLAKRGDLHARRQALSKLGQDKFAVHKLFEEIAPRYAQRTGGYTRIVKLGPRRSRLGRDGLSRARLAPDLEGRAGAAAVGADRDHHADGEGHDHAEHEPLSPALDRRDRGDAERDPETAAKAL